MALRRVVRQLFPPRDRRTLRQLPAGSNGHGICIPPRYDRRLDTTVITEIGDYFKNEMDYDIPPRTPFVGRDFNITKAGIHADGLLKDEEIYNIFNTEKILNRPPQVAIDAHSGAAGIAHWVNRKLASQGIMTDKIDKRSPLITLMKEFVDYEYEAGRVTTLSDDELTLIMDTARATIAAETN